MLYRFPAAFVLALLLLAVPAAAEKRVALVVGNSNYTEVGTLPNPVNDANLISSALKSAGFEVILGVNVDKREFDTRIRNFAALLENADVAIFFYAGHGLQVSGHNYLIPVDAHLQGERDLDFDAVNLDFIMKQMELGREDKTNIVFLDACRDNPFTRNLARSMGTRSVSIGKGLAQVETGVGTFIAYSTQPGNVALDGSGANSPFTAALSKHVREPGRDLTSVMIETRKDVLAATNGKQVPWDHSALTGEFYFQQQAALPGSGATAPGNAPGPDVLQQRVRTLEDELKKKPGPEQTADIVALAQARERVRELEEQNSADQQKIFDRQYEQGGNEAASARTNLAMEIGKIQMQMVRRGQEQKKLREQISTLETKLGLPPQSTARDAK